MVFPPEFHNYISILAALRGRDWAKFPIKGERLGIKGERLGKISTSFAGEKKGRDWAKIVTLKGRVDKFFLMVSSPDNCRYSLVYESNANTRFRTFHA